MAYTWTVVDATRGIIAVDVDGETGYVVCETTYASAAHNHYLSVMRRRATNAQPESHVANVERYAPRYGYGF